MTAFGWEDVKTSFFIFIKKCYYLILERRREGGKEGEKYMLVTSPPTLGQLVGWWPC